MKEGTTEERRQRFTSVIAVKKKEREREKEETLAWLLAINLLEKPYLS